MKIAKPNIIISCICVFYKLFMLWTLEHFVKHYTCIYKNQDLEMCKGNGHNNKDNHQYINTSHPDVMVYRVTTLL